VPKTVPKSKLKAEPKTESWKALLTSISDHQIFKDYHEYLLDDVYLLKLAKHLTPEAVRLILELHPIYVVEIKKQLTCIAGVRVLNIASHVLPLDEQITVSKFKKLDEAQIASYCYADLLLSPLALSLGKDGHFTIDKLILKIGSGGESWSDLADCGKVDLSKAFGLSRGCLYSHDRKQQKAKH